MWVRLHKDCKVGSTEGLSFGWHLWRQRNANFPRHEMGLGFQYLICDQPTANAASRTTVTLATVRKFMPFRDATSLNDAYRIARAEFRGDFEMTLDEWLDDPYNGPIDPKWSGIFGMWMLDAERIEPIVGNWSFANCFCGWKQIDYVRAAA